MAQPMFTCVSALTLYLLDQNKDCGYSTVGLLFGVGVHWRGTLSCTLTFPSQHWPAVHTATFKQNMHKLAHVMEKYCFYLEY